MWHPQGRTRCVALTLTQAGHQIADELEATEKAFAGKLDEASRVINSIASVLDETAPLQG